MSDPSVLANVSSVIEKTINRVCCRSELDRIFEQASPFAIEEQICHFKNIHDILYINYDHGELKRNDLHCWEAEEAEPPSIFDRFATNNIPVKKTIRFGSYAGDEDDGDHESPKRGPLSVYSKSSVFRRDLRKKGKYHLTHKFVPTQKPIPMDPEDPEDLFTRQMRAIKIKEFERDQEEIKKAKDLRRRLLAKSKAAAIKNEEKLLSKKAYTYNYNGEIIFVKMNNNEKFPTTLSQPRIGTKLKPVAQMPENTIHAIRNINMSQDEIVQKHFKPTSTQKEPEKVNKRRKKIKHLGKYFNNMVEPAGSNFDVMSASQGVCILENGKIKKGPLMKRNSSQETFQFGRRTSAFSSTINSQKSVGKFDPNSPSSTQQLNPILPNDQHILMVTGDYDTLMSGPELMTTRKLNRVASQGMISTDKDFDVTTLFLPDIGGDPMTRIEKSKISQQIFNKPSLLNITSMKKEFKDSSKVDDLNQNIMMNPTWGQHTKAEGLEHQNAARKPQIHNLIKSNKIEKLGTNKKKGSFLARMRMKNLTPHSHLPQPPLGESIGHGILKNEL
ncbi:unnamed protein product [Moneuplotes crassus]|uniref:Uncharacterized protein n=1 Tax=Euplotes crassus TaxID=5936 RepID=A0AAD1U3T2_EUPCR|nr:unnamed protein product [Moneuplotes crassus]